MNAESNKQSEKIFLRRIFIVLAAVFFLLAVAVAITSIEWQDELPTILGKIKAVDEVQYNSIGIGGSESAQYKRFVSLKDKADMPELLRLTDDESAVVACYAGWALVDKSYEDLPGIFSKFLNSGKTVKTFRGCIKWRRSLASEFYGRYCNKVGNERKATDATLLALDSIILYNENSDWLLTSGALENRVYPNAFRGRIECLAFEKTNRAAISYLSNWHKEEYAGRIRQALEKYLLDTEFKKTGVSDYYEVVAELLKSNDDRIKKIVIGKLEKDTFWKRDASKFHALLGEHGIHPIDLE